MKNFIKVNIVGGIGNQLFVLAFGLAVSEHLKTKLIVDDSLINFGSNKSRRIEISNLIFDAFNIEYKNSMLSKLFFNKTNTVLSKIIWKFFKFNKNITSERDQSKSQFKFTTGKTFSGYFHDWFYIDYINELHPNFSFNLKNPSPFYFKLAKEAEQSKPIFVHVRLGDYLNFPEIFSILPEHYFLDSLNHLGSAHNNRIWLFSEHLDQVKEFYPELVTKVHKVIDKKTELNDLESFKLLCQGTKLIASNSTFSMWAAWFVHRNGFKAVVPKQFGVKGGSASLSDDRWDCYDLEKREITPGIKSNSRYLEEKKEFLSKFQ